MERFQYVASSWGVGASSFAHQFAAPPPDPPYSLYPPSASSATGDLERWRARSQPGGLLSGDGGPGHAWGRAPSEPPPPKAIIKVNILAASDGGVSGEGSAWQIGERLARAAGDRRSNIRGGRALWNLSGMAVVDAHSIWPQHVTELRLLSAAALNDQLCFLEARIIDNDAIPPLPLREILRLINGARQPLRDQSMLAFHKRAAEVQLTLDVDFHEVLGREQQVKEGISLDVARAVGGHEGRVYVESLRNGSVIARVYLLDGVCNDGRQPGDAARELEQQVLNANSPLRRGVWTNKAIGVQCLASAALPPAQDDVKWTGAGEGKVAGALAKVGNLYINAMLMAHDDKQLATMKVEAERLKNLAERWGNAALAICKTQGTDQGGEAALKEAMQALEALHALFDKAQLPQQRQERREMARERAMRASWLYTKVPWYVSGVSSGMLLPEPEEDYTERSVAWVKDISTKLPPVQETLRKAAEELARAQEMKALELALEDQRKRDDSTRVLLQSLHGEAVKAGGLIPGSLLSVKPAQKSTECQTSEVVSTETSPLPGVCTIISPWSWIASQAAATGRAPSPRGGIIRRLGNICGLLRASAPSWGNGTVGVGSVGGWAGGASGLGLQGLSEGGSGFVNPAKVGPSQYTRLTRVRSSAWGVGTPFDLLEPLPPLGGVASLPEGVTVDDDRRISAWRERAADVAAGNGAGGMVGGTGVVGGPWVTVELPPWLWVVPSHYTYVYMCARFVSACV